MNQRQCPCEKWLKITGADVVEKACAAAFGKPLIINNLRSILVEAMVDEALSSDWNWVSGDWAGWDFEDNDGVRIEVKQSAAKQTWAKECAPPSKCSFDIAPRTGHYVGETWVKGHRRYANIYIFAHHSVHDRSADHRDPHQWQFYVVNETSLLPASKKTVSLSVLRKLIEPIKIEHLAEQVERSKAELKTSRT